MKTLLMISALSVFSSVALGQGALDEPVVVVSPVQVKTPVQDPKSKSVVQYRASSGEGWYLGKRLGARSRGSRAFCFGAGCGR